MCKFRHLVCLMILYSVVLGTLGCVPDSHPLLKKAQPEKQDQLEAVKFEVGYLTYLSVFTIAIIAGLLGLIYTTKPTGLRRWTICSSAMALLIAITFVTVGYAIRNGWVVSNSPLPKSVIWIDLYVNGPVTAIAYIFGLVCMLIGIGMTLFQRQNADES